MAPSVVNIPSGTIKPHPAFGKVVKGKTGLYIWHVVVSFIRFHKLSIKVHKIPQKFDLEEVPENQYGNFFSGDCYLVLCVMDERMNDMRVHFWIGSQCTADERGTAAMMAVALDDAFGGFPVQTREVQGAESSMFMKYFADMNKPIRYMDGGVDSGFHHYVKPQHRNAFYQVKGSVKSCRIFEVPITWDSVNEGDSYILDLGAVIFVWKGKLSKRSESFSAAHFANQLRQDRGISNCLVVPVEDGYEECELGDSYLELWNKYLPLERKSVKPASEAGSDQAVVKDLTSRIKLFRCKEQNGKTSIDELKSGPLHKDDLLSEDAFIIDNGALGVWAWIGKQASSNERRFAMHYATEFVREKNYPASTRVTRVIDGAEPPQFQSLFASWPVPESKCVYQFNKIAKPDSVNFDAKSLHENRKFAAEVQMIDSGKGNKEIYRVERSNDSGKATYELVAQEDTVLYGGDCYVIVYLAETGQAVIYYWIGRNSSVDEKGACARLVVDMDITKFEGNAIQVRVCQGKEPRHLMAIFGGLMIILDGGKAGWSAEERDKYLGGEFLLQVHCRSQLDKKVIQIPLSSSCLNSADTFVLVSKGQSIIWKGSGAEESEVELAKDVAKRFAPNADASVTTEGSESDDFWELIGGKKQYADSNVLATDGEPFYPRLFQCTNRTGRLEVNEIENFTQDDLISDDVMMLDANDTIFVWIGNESNKKERDFSLTMAAVCYFLIFVYIAYLFLFHYIQDYLKSDPRGRDQSLPIFVIKQGYEPPSFTGFFLAWDPKLWNVGFVFMKDFLRLL